MPSQYWLEIVTSRSSLAATEIYILRDSTDEQLILQSFFNPFRSSGGGASPGRSSALRAPSSGTAGSNTATTATYGAASPITHVPSSHGYSSLQHQPKHRIPTVDKSLPQREQQSKSTLSKQGEKRATVLSSNSHASRSGSRMEHDLPPAGQGGSDRRPLPPPRVQSLPGSNSNSDLKSTSNGDRSQLQQYENSQILASKVQHGNKGIRSPKLSSKNKVSSESHYSARGHQPSNHPSESSSQRPFSPNQPSRRIAAVVSSSSPPTQVPSGIKSPKRSPRQVREGNIAPLLPSNLPPALRQNQDHEGLAYSSSSIQNPSKGIPKPTAHVKGQTKIIAPTGSTTSVSLTHNSSTQNIQSPIKEFKKNNVSPPAIVNSSNYSKDVRNIPTTVSQNLNKATINKDYNKMVRQSSSTQTQKSNTADVQSKSNPLEVSNGKYKYEDKASLPHQKQSSSNVALVSPMPKQNPTEKVPKQSTSITSPRSKHIPNASTKNLHGNTSGLYKDSSLENTRMNGIKANISQAYVKRSDGMGNAPLILNIEAMQPTMQPSLYRYNQYRSQQQKTASNNIVTKKSSKTSPQRGIHLAYNQNDSDYSDIENTQILNGYSSDGDMLGSRSTKSATSGDQEGYLSEGGASLYSQRVNQRIQEGMRHLQNNISKAAQYTQDDSFDDSSSLSSGVSDTLNDLSQDDINFYPDCQNLTKGITKLHESGMRLPISLSGSPVHKGDTVTESTKFQKPITSSRANVKKAEASQQTDKSAFKQISNTQWKKFVDSSQGGLEQSAREFKKISDSSLIGGISQTYNQKRSNLAPLQSTDPSFQKINGGSTVISTLMGSQQHEKKREGIYTSRDKSVSLLPTQLNGESKPIHNIKTLSSSIGKKSPASNSSNSKSHILKESDALNRSGSYQDRESHSLDRLLERPRTKIKVSGGTQTIPDSQYKGAGVQSDGEYSSNSLGREYQLKTYSLNGPVASHLSQNVKERIMQSSYGKMHVGEYSQYASTPYYRERNSRKSTDGSLSDSPYATYSDIYSSSPYSSPYSSWVNRGSGYASSVTSAPSSRPGGSLTEGESLESLSSSASSVAAQLLHTRDSRLTQAQLMMHQMSASTSPKLARSNSVRSTKSEKLYGATTSGEQESYHMSQPTSPTPSGHRLSRTLFNSGSGSPYYSSGLTTSSKNDECHGSQLSLLSSESSLYSSHEDKHNSEIRKLRRELNDAESKIGTLTNQLTNNEAHVVAAFEKSLTKMTNRLTHLTASSKQKDSEVTDLRKTIEALRQQSIEAGLTVASIQK
ncbi:unnamed protein product, partial [Meganyctiphanes norvegica]